MSIVFSGCTKMENWSADDLNALNAVTEMMMAYLNKMGWRFRAYKTPEGWKYEYPPV